MRSIGYLRAAGAFGEEIPSVPPTGKPRGIASPFQKSVRLDLTAGDHYPFHDI